MFSALSSARRRAAYQGICLTRLSHNSLLRTAATTARGQPLEVGDEYVPNAKLNQKVDPRFVEPVIDWLLDDKAEMPFIPVKATFESKAPSWLPLSNFCGPFKKDHVVQLDPSVFHHPIRKDILHACITWYRDSLRTGTASTKTRGEVNGSNKKLRPQKGTGKARLGDRGSPMLRGGGRAFGPKPRDFSTELPRKVREMGLRIALSARLRERNVLVVPSVSWPNGKTRFVAQRLKGLKPGRRCLLVTGDSEVSPKLIQATRNIRGVACKTAEEIQVWDILHASQVVLSLDAVEWLHNNLSKATSSPRVDIGTKEQVLDEHPIATPEASTLNDRTTPEAVA